MSSFSDPNRGKQAQPLLPSRIDICLPGVPNRLLPTPFDRIYNVQNRRLELDCFDMLNYTVQVLLDVASHISPTERSRLSRQPVVYVDLASGLMVHCKERLLANYSMECILTQHNSTDPLVFYPSWPGVFFDEDGYPYFAEPRSSADERPKIIPTTARVAPSAAPESDDKTLDGEAIALSEPSPPVELSRHHYIPTEPHQFLPQEPTDEYVPEQTKKRRYVPKQPDQFSSFTFQRL